MKTLQHTRKPNCHFEGVKKFNVQKSLIVVFKAFFIREILACNENQIKFNFRLI